MCFGGGPQAPQVVYQGPSQEEIARNQASLDTYKAQMQQQQGDFSKQLQAQIDAANAETASLRSKYDQESAAAAASAASQQTGAYASTTQTVAPTNAATTATALKKEKPKSSLKISTAGTPATAGTGLNIGV